MSAFAAVAKRRRPIRLALAILAVVALALMVSWGHQSAQRASADETSEVEFSISATGCTTTDTAEADKCTQTVGSSFTVDVNWDGFSGGHLAVLGLAAEGRRGRAATLRVHDFFTVQAAVHWSGAVSGPTVANGKSLINEAPPGCDIPIARVEPGGDTTRALLSCQTLFGVDVATGLLGSAVFNCDSAGVGTIDLEHGAAQTLVIIENQAPHFEDNGTDTLTINCLPPTPTPTPTNTPNATPTPTHTATPVPPTPIGGVGIFPGTPGAGADTGGVAVLTWLAAVAAGAVALGGAAWYARRRPD